MPVVSTRSKINYHEHNDPGQSTRTRSDHEQRYLSDQFRNPHHGLKEKMKALTLLYEQQKKASMALRNQSPKPEENRFSTHHSRVGLLNSCKKEFKETENSEHGNVMRENTMHQLVPNLNPNFTVTKTYVLPRPPTEDDAKENLVMGTDRVIGFSSCARRASGSNAVARKLSVPQTEPRGLLVGKKLQEIEKLEAVSEKIEMDGSRVLVFVRVRPISKKEKESGLRCCVKIVNGKDVYLTEFASENDYLRLKRLRGRHFTYDASFPDSTSQQQVYSTTTAELVEAVLQGRNGSVFCYGATGAGKTYTMLGTVENPGVMVLAVRDLFTKIRHGNHVVHLSYLEVYNETVRDLLSPGRPLVLREDKQGIIAAGLTQYRAYSTDEVMALLQRGNQNRTTEPTRANETSSRSHAILQVAVEYRVKDGSGNVVKRAGKLSLIDLAGSERALATDQTTLRSLEGANINRSLLALSSCINALVEGKKHIPYRNSKLTQLLKDSLGGACNTVMIANISPTNLSFGETQNTLHWADRAKEIRTKGCEANVELLQLQLLESGVDQSKLLLKLQKENRELRVQLAKQQQKLLTAQAQSMAAKASPTTSQPIEKRKTKTSFLGGNCFTPESTRKGGDEAVKELHQKVKTLEAEIERMKKDNALQIKQKDDQIRELSRKSEKGFLAEKGTKESSGGELMSLSQRFKSPVSTAKKRSFCDITTANSPSAYGRKTRSHVTTEAPSMLLQPGFARQRP